MKDRPKRLLRSICVAAFWIAVWYLAALAVGSELLLPTPLAAGRRLFALAATGTFWLTLLMTLLRIMCGFVSGMLAGTLLGMLTAGSRFADAVLSPVRSVVKATPVASIIILVLLWFSKSLTPVFISFIMVVPIAWTAVHQGILSTDAQLLEMARVFRIPRAKQLRYIYFPSLAPQYIAASMTAFGLSWKAGVTAEVLATPALSIGKHIYESKLYLEIPELFAWTVTIILMSMMIEKALIALIRRLAK